MSDTGAWPAAQKLLPCGDPVRLVLQMPLPALLRAPGVGDRSRSRAVSSLVCLRRLLAKTSTIRKRFGLSFH